MAIYLMAYTYLKHYVYVLGEVGELEILADTFNFLYFSIWTWLADEQTWLYDFIFKTLIKKGVNK